MSGPVQSREAPEGVVGYAGLTLEAVVKSHLAHDLLVLAAQEGVHVVGMEQMMGDTVEGVGVQT